MAKYITLGLLSLIVVAFLFQEVGCYGTTYKETPVIVCLD